jgi:hypothetical protein
MRRSLIMCTLYKGNEIKEYEMSGACMVHVRDEKYLQSVGWKTRKEKTT